MIGGVTRQDRLPCLPDRVTLSVGVKFCQVNVSRWGNPPTRGRIHDTSYSPKIHYGGDFASLLKVTQKATAVKVAATAASECRRALIAKTRGLPAFF